MNFRNFIIQLLQFLILALLAFNYCQAGSLGSISGLNGGYGAVAAPALAAPVASLDADFQAKRTVEVRPVALQSDYPQPQIIEVAPEELPVQVHFRTASSRVNVHQSHTPGKRDLNLKLKCMKSKLFYLCLIL